MSILFTLFVCIAVSSSSPVHNKLLSMYKIVERGTPNSLDYRLFYTRDGVPVSAFHDIPLYSDDSKKVVNMVVEIPRWTNAKMEICKEEPLNPIKQDVKKGKLRFVNNVFPYHGYMWNYGALPQTWEDPSHVDKNTTAKGDNDPIDAIEIGSKIASRGELKQVKVLGVLAMVDEGETDWKVVTIDVNDPLANSVNDIADVEREMPGILAATRDWFRIYKVPTGKPMNDFGFKGDWQNREFALNIIHETHEFWNNLMKSKDSIGGISTQNTSQANTPHLISPDAAARSWPNIRNPTVKDPRLISRYITRPLSNGRCASPLLLKPPKHILKGDDP